MPHATKFLSALGVLTIGGATASLYLKEAADPQPLGSEIEPLVNRSPSGARPLMEFRASHLESLESSTDDQAAADLLGGAGPPQAVNTSFFEPADNALPRIPREYPLQPSRAPQTVVAALSPPLRAAVEGQPAGEPQRAPRPTTHQVVDGDTLQDLAERYLGSADRRNEFYAANRDILQDPELLPIGAVLRIPAR